MEALELLNRGQLDEAIASATGFVRDSPRATGARESLAELFCLRGDLDRADKQLETALQQDPGSALNMVLIRQLIRAETARREFWKQGRLPEFLAGPDPEMQQRLLAVVALQAGRLGEARDILAEIEDRRAAVAGTCDGEAFGDFRDLDDVCAGVFEVLTSTGKYYWIPVDRVESLVFTPVARPRDLLWRQCQMSVADGPDGVVFIPVIYPATPADAPLSLRLGRETQWAETGDGPVQGLGQRVFGCDDRDVPVLAAGELTFSRDG